MSSKHQNSNSLLLSICVPTYNRSELLKEMLDSVNCLYLDKIEIVIVDDGSKDSTKKLCKEYKVKQFKRVYCNAHTHGIEPHLHYDDGDFTMIYYPILDWKPEWMGGTAIWNEQENEIEKYVNYIGNRLFVFSANAPHQAMTVSRQCYELRTCIVFKTFRNDANADRLDFYK